MSESLSVNDAKKMRSVELRQELAARNLDTTGTKPRLLTRLLESLEFTAVREDLATQAAEQNLPQATAAPSLRDIIREEVRAAFGNQAAAPVPPAAHAAAPPPPAHAAALPRQAPATPHDALPAPHLAAAVSPPMNPAGKRTFYATVPKAIHDKVVTGQFVELGSLSHNPYKRGHQPQHSPDRSRQLARRSGPSTGQQALQKGRGHRHLARRLDNILRDLRHSTPLQGPRAVCVPADYPESSPEISI